MNNIKLLAALVLAIGASQGQAATVYSNSVGSYNGNGNETTAWQQANDFTLTTGAAITGATVYVGAYTDLAPYAGSVGYSFYSDANGIPGTLLESGTAAATLTDTGASAFNTEIYGVSFATTAFNAAANTTYFLGFHMGTGYGSRDEIYWVGAQSPIDADGVESYGGTLNNWSDNGQSHVFSLTSAVPEPTNAALMLLGVAGLAGVMRRRARRA